MHRKEFIKVCYFSCISGVGMSSLLQSCGISRQSTGKIIGDELIIPVSEFKNSKQKPDEFIKYLIIQNDILQFPICVYRFSENEYSALWMQCTHQGTELQVFGDKLQCPAHGSEFTNKGTVHNGPAELKLRTFPISIENDLVKISLKAR
jgi:nitrite reductase/ring-hydroxylating ferredoxin subunit